MFRTRAEFLPNTGGHAHIHAPIRFETAVRLPSGPEVGRPLYGYFFTGAGQKHANLSITSDSSGAVQSRLVAGYVGGEARVVASASVDGAVVADSAIVAYVLPGLVKLEDSVTGVYWIGGDAAHEEGDNHYAQDSVVARLQTIADSMQATVNGTTLYTPVQRCQSPGWRDVQRASARCARGTSIQRRTPRAQHRSRHRYRVLLLGPYG
jgi:hypothetical protein